MSKQKNTTKGSKPAKASKATKVTKKAAAATKNAKATKTKQAAASNGKKLSAIDAAAKVLGEVGQPMNTKAMVDLMASKGYWTTPGGKTPWATLYSAILSEINSKGKEARFKKTDRGHFALNA